jgi:hypothetical protein
LKNINKKVQKMNNVALFIKFPLWLKRRRYEIYFLEVIILKKLKYNSYLYTGTVF